MKPKKKNPKAHEVDPNGERFAPYSEDIIITPSKDKNAKSALDVLRKAGVDVDHLTDEDVAPRDPNKTPPPEKPADTEG